MNIRNISIWLSLFIVIAFISGCSLENPVDTLEVEVQLPQIETVVSGTIIDAATGKPMGMNNNTVAYVKVLGEDKSAVVDMLNDVVSEFTVNSGVMGFAIADGVHPTAEDPVKIITMSSKSRTESSAPRSNFR